MKFFLSKFLEFEHDTYNMDKVLKSLQPYVYFYRALHSEEKVFSVTFVAA
jgi:hypothetical protein